MRPLPLLLLAACAPAQPGPVGLSPATARSTPVPVIGGTLLRLDETLAIAADPDGDRLWRVDLSGAEPALTPIDLPSGARPGRLVEDGGRILAIARGLGGLVVVDDDATEVIEVCPDPRGVDVGDDGSAWVACADGQVVGLDPALTEIARWSVDDDLRDVVAVDELLWVSRFRAAEVLVLDRSGALLARLAPPVAVGPDGAVLEPAVAWRMVADPAGAVLLAHQRASSGLIDLEQGFGTPAYGGADCDAVVQTGLTRFTADGVAETVPPLSKTVLPVDVIAGDDGGAWLVAAGATGLSDVAVGQVAPGLFGADDSCVALPGVPWSSVVEADGRVVAAVEIGGGLLMQTQAPLGFAWAPEGAVTARIVEDPADARGHALFHAAPTGTVACASCHPEGGEDGRTWRFRRGEGEEPRRTQSLAGGVAVATAPLHWVGEHPDLQSLLEDSFVARIGGTLEEGDAEAVGRFLAEVPPAWAPAVDEALIARGEALFDQGGCAGCHAGPWLTDGLEHDVGTGDGERSSAFQTPSLVGVGARGPWMHDGCARTLEQRFDPACGGEAHGIVPTDPEDVEALAAWLASR